jgi:PAS domain S-box-containing protein
LELTDNIYINILEASPFPVYLCTGESKIVTMANKAALKAWGKDESVIGLPFDEALPEMRDQPFSDQITRVYETGEPYYASNERADVMVDGKLQTFYYKFSFQPMRDREGKILGVICFSTDVTELEFGRQAVEESRSSLYNLVRQAPVGICIVKGNPLYVEVVNDSFLSTVRKKRSDFEDTPYWKALPEAAHIYEPITEDVLQTGETYFAVEHEIMVIKDGDEEPAFFDFVFQPIRDFDGTLQTIMIIALDVTEKVNARHKIEESEERARLAIQAAEIGTFDLDLETEIILASDRYKAIMGFKDPVKREMFAEAVHPDDRPIRIKSLEEALITGKLFFEVRILWPDESEHWLRAQGNVYFGQDRKPVRILGTLLDITEYKRLQQQKDDFISVASHELKTPLTSIKATLQLIDKMITNDPASDKVPVFLNKANNSLLKMQQLIDTLLDVSKITSGKLRLHKQHFKVSDLVNECCDHFRVMATHDIEITGDENLIIYADKERIEQVLVNFVNNAVKYAPESNKIIVHISKEGTSAKIAVQDFGRGIPADKIPHLFERYYRVNESGVQYSGLGLGLYISADIIERHGGQIGVDSTEGEGSTFWFKLPVL